MVCNVKYTSDALSVCLSICTKESIKRLNAMMMMMMMMMMMD
tara:strand:- start:520 stop:645 length:126 start_codon:yes stop_codon:yes gene_type:complete